MNILTTNKLINSSLTKLSRSFSKFFSKLNENFQRGNDNTMGQRDGFANSDLQKLNKMYRCSNVPVDNSGPSAPSPGINKPTYPRPTFQKPNRPFAGGSSSGGGNGGGGFTNPIASVISGIGSFFQGLGGKHDEIDNFEETNILEEN